jgi:hypothetical protein
MPLRVLHLTRGFFRDLSDIGSMIHEPGRYMGHWLLNWAPNWLPWSIGMGQINRFGFDPYSKDVHGFDAQAVFDSFRGRSLVQASMCQIEWTCSAILFWLGVVGPLIISSI